MAPASTPRKQGFLAHRVADVMAFTRSPPPPREPREPRPPMRARAAALASSAARARSLAARVARHTPAYALLWAQLVARLLTLLGGGATWLVKAVALVLYAALLLPGFVKVREREEAGVSSVVRGAREVKGSQGRPPPFQWRGFGAPARSTTPFLLSPPSTQIGHFYFTSPRVIRGIRYGRRPRNALDLYFPPGVDARSATAAAVAAVAAAGAGDPKARRAAAASAPTSTTPRPVVVYVTGGAWIIGHRAWGALLCARLSARGAIVACADYRNFPQAAADGMVADVRDAIGWAVAARRPLSGGGDGKVVVVGQSAGAHVSALALLAAAASEDGVTLPYDGVEDERTPHPPRGRARSLSPSTDDDDHPRPLAHPPLSATVGADPGAPLPLAWRATDVGAFVGVSGVYDVARLAGHFAAHGLRPALQARVFSVRGVPAALKDVSPTQVLLSAASTRSGWPSRLPRCLLLHGTADACAPAGDAARFVEAALAAGAPSATLRLYDGDTHTSPLIENPMRGGRADALAADVCAAVGVDTGAAGAEPGLCPGALIWAAARVCPF